MRRAIDACNDVAALREMCRSLAEAWFGQCAATAWAIRQQSPPTMTHPTPRTWRVHFTDGGHHDIEALSAERAHLTAVELFSPRRVARVAPLGEW